MIDELDVDGMNIKEIRIAKHLIGDYLFIRLVDGRGLQIPISDPPSCCEIIEALKQFRERIKRAEDQDANLFAEPKKLRTSWTSTKGIREEQPVVDPDHINIALEQAGFIRFEVGDEIRVCIEGLECDGCISAITNTQVIMTFNKFAGPPGRFVVSHKEFCECLCAPVLLPKSL